MFPRVRGDRQSGQGNVEYVGMVVAVGVLLVAVATALPSIGDSVTCKVSQAIASITGDSADCSGGASGVAQEPEDDENGENSGAVPGPVMGPEPSPSPGPPPPPSPPKPAVPYGLNSNSNLVKTLQSTPRGRQAMQWLIDESVPVKIDKSKNGAWFDPPAWPRWLNGDGKIVLGNGYDEAPVLIHEVNHARYDKEGRSADPWDFGRKGYIDAAIDEEVDGTVQQIQAAQEFRAAGHNVPSQPGETEYNNAYQNAKANGASNADAESAGYNAVEQKFYDKGPAGFRASTSGKTYPDYYGDEWDSVHLCSLHPLC